MKDINNPNTMNIFISIRRYYQLSVNKAVEYIDAHRYAPLTEDEKMLLGLTISGLNLGRLWQNEETDDRKHIMHAIDVIFDNYMKE